MHASKDILDPQAPHDELSFEELMATYSFDSTSDRRRVFCNLVVSEIQRRQGSARVLDIGCGAGMGTDSRSFDFVRAIADAATSVTGIEPDPSVSPPEGIFESIERCLLEDSQLPHSSFDVAYAHYVVEHVADPVRFLTKVRELLKPGGTFLFITPNAWSYFGIITRLLHAISLDEWVLRRVRETSTVEAYHYPVAYKLNSKGQIDRAAQQAGLPPADVAYFDIRGNDSYFPTPLMFVWHGLMWKRKVIRNPRCLCNLLGRIQMPAEQ